MKYLYSLVLVISFLSCSNDNWSTDEKNIFLTGCINEGGSKVYCECYLENVMQYSPIAEDANALDYETKIELSKDCVSK